MEMKIRKRQLGLVSCVAMLLWISQAGPLVSAASDPGDACEYQYLFSYPQLVAIMNLYTNWSGTPNPDVNLEDWGPYTISYNESLDYYWWYETCDLNPWKGVQCFTLYEDVPGYVYNCTNTSTVPTTTYRITGLTFNNASLTGPLPAAIGDLYPLNTLTLTGNPNLYGNIPQEIANLNLSLITLDLHDNNLSGAIPSSIFDKDSSNLQTLDLSGNRFTGQIDKDMSWDMRTLNFARNQLTGNFSGFYLQYMSQLETLDLSHNKLSGSLLRDVFSSNLILKYLDLSNNEFSGPVPNINFSDNSYLNYMNISGNQFTSESLESIDILAANTTASPIQVLDLSNNAIHGVVDNLSSIIEGLGLQLQGLYLDNNNISGTLFLDNVLQSTVFRQNSNFKILSLTNNNIRGVRYNKNDTVNILRFMRLGDNPFCNNTIDVCGADGYAARCFCYQDCTDLPACNQAASSRAAILKIALSTSVPFALLLLVGTILLYRSRRQHQYLLLQVQKICEEHDVKPTIFTYNELRAATHDFHPDMKLGQGGYGAVYKGVLPSGNVVAVKQLLINSHQGMDEFLNEVVLISGIKHRNLVKLKGCCIREKQRLLVYEYVDNHDLDWNLLKGKSSHVLSWPERLSICLGIAHGLHYLHALAQPKIIHRDIKAANILLDSNLQPKIADFGLALLFPEETSHIMTVHVAGTKGYLAPEYATLGQLSEKADVYSFGVVCLEIVSGRRNIDNKKPLEKAVLTNWIQKLYKEGNFMDIIDSRLESLNSNEHLEAQRVIHTAMLCLQYSEDVRPTMAHVVSILQGNLPSTMVGDLESGQTPPNLINTINSFEISHLGLETISEAESNCLHGGSFCSTSEPRGISLTHFR